jgi:thiol-disulfide isomerase/thioredoxin
MKQLQILLISFLIFSCTANEKVEKAEEEIKLVSEQDDLKTFEWSAYYFKKGKDKLNPEEVRYDVIGNAEQRIDDTTLWILPLATSQILIELETGVNKKTYGLAASTNQLVDSSWYNVPNGEIPTPLDRESLGAWTNFSQFRYWGQMVPAFRHYDYLTADTVTETIFHGKLTLLNFWYRGCMPCMAEMPALQRLKEDWDGEDDVQFISICLDSIYVKDGRVFVNSGSIHSTKTIPDYKIETGFRQIGLGRAIADSFRVKAYPTNLIIDRDGKVRKVLIGANPENDNNGLANNLTREIEHIRQQEKLNFEVQTERVIILE